MCSYSYVPSDLQLLRKVLVRLAATRGSAGSAGVEEAVAEELERRVFWETSISLERKEVGEERSELSGMVSGATVDAEKVAWFEGSRVRKWLVGWLDIVMVALWRWALVGLGLVGVFVVGWGVGRLNLLLFLNAPALHVFLWLILAGQREV